MKIWKAVPGFEGFYDVANDGSIRSVRSGKPMRPFWRGNYACVSMKVSGKATLRLVHNLVLEAFGGERPQGHFAAHLDGDRANNALANLRWVTQAENEAHKLLHGTDQRGEKSSHAKLSNTQAEIVREIVAAGISQTKVSLLLGIAESTVSRIVRGARYV